MTEPENAAQPPTQGGRAFGWTSGKKRSGSAAQEVRHVPFNPTVLGLGPGPLPAICDEHERAGWRLVQVVPHHQYESIAVFVREATDGT